MPPLGAVEAFIVGARARSFRSAAETLALSPSAFSRRIQLLEAFVETTLFDRTGATPMLTQAGERYLRDLESAVDTIRRGTDALRANYRRAPLRVTASLSILTTWLMPRLRDFTDAHPDIPVEIAATGGTDALRRGDADVALFGDIEMPDGIACEKLIDGDGVALASPDWVAEHGMIETIDGLTNAPLLGTTRPGQMWDRWLAELGHGDRNPKPVGHFQTIVLTYEAASAGMGIALGAPLAAERFVREGRLVRCFAATGPVGASYFVGFADAGAGQRRDARCFADWLGAEAHTSKLALSTMLAAH